MDDVHGRWHPDGHMVQAWPRAVGEGHVVDVAFAMHPHRPQLRIIIFGNGVLRGAKAQIERPEVVAGLHVGGEAVEMVDALGMAAAIDAIFLQHPLRLGKFVAEFQRHAKWVAHL